MTCRDDDEDETPEIPESVLEGAKQIAEGETVSKEELLEDAKDSTDSN